MSLDATRWAWDQAGIKSSDKLVLLALADRADDSNTCWPAIDRLSSDTCLNKETVIASIKRLAEAGLIEVKKRWGQSPIYRLFVGSKLTSIPENQNSDKAELLKPGKQDDSIPENQNSEKPCSSIPENPSPVFRKPGKESTNESTNESLNNSFVRFWSTYPRKDGKEKALKAFTKINPDQPLLDQMISNVTGRLARGEWSDPKYIPMPTTYLNGKRWEDEPLKSAQVHTMPKQSGIARAFGEIDYREGVTADGSF